MERWGVRESVCAVVLFIRTGSITEAQRGFKCEQDQQEAPSQNAIRRWVRQWSEEGSVTWKKPLGRPSSVRTPYNIAQVLASVSRSPRRSARKHGQALRLSERSARRILRSDLSLHPYKLQVEYALSNRDREMRLQFCRKFVGILSENTDLPNKLLMSDDAHFHLHGTVNAFTAIVDLSRFNNSCLKSPASTLVDLTFQSRALRSFSLNQLRNLSL